MQDLEALEFQDKLLRGITHKMNNILSLFHGYLGMVLDNPKLDPETVSCLNRIQEGAFSASELMDRTQSLIRPSAVTLRELNLSEVLRASRSGFESLATRGILIEIKWQDNLPPVCGDVGRIRTILSEIISNAVEASPDNETIFIEAALQPNPDHNGKSIRTGHWAVITVRNKGKEIPPETLKRVFEPFFTTRQSRNAFGLGLAIARAMAKPLGGALRFDRLGEETACSLSLPVL